MQSTGLYEIIRKGFSEKVTTEHPENESMAEEIQGCD